MIASSRQVLFYLLIFFFSSLFAQDPNISGKSVTLQWQINRGQISFAGAVYPKEFSGLPVYSFAWNNGRNGGVDAALTNAVYKPLQGFNLSQVQISQISNQPIVKTYVGIERKNSIATVTVFPFRNNNGQVEVLSSFDLSFSPSGSANRTSNISAHTYPANSILNNGKFYKFGVSKAGVYKLDYTFLKNLGLNVDAINPSGIRIFGQRAGMLPELSGAAREDDSKEIPVKVVAASASRFQPGDYVLAYLPGPEQWTYNTSKQMFLAKKHLYSDTKNFFITADAGAGARINTVASSPLPETKNISTYDDYEFFEENKVNIAQSGKQFLGDEFGGITDKSYNFNFPNLVAGQLVKLTVAVAASSLSNGSTFTVTTDNGNNASSIFIRIDSEPYPEIFDVARREERTLALSNLSSSFNINLNYDRNGDFNTKGWLDYLQVNAPSTLRYNGQPLYFRSIASVGAGSISKFSVQNMTSNVEIWDVTDPFNIQKINYDLSGNTATFNIATDTLKEFVAVENSTAVPTAMGSVSNQNLHALPQADMIIVARTSFMSQAQDLAQFHRDKQNLRVAVADLNQVYNEFSSGTNDVTAVRNFVKMFYDRAGGNPSQLPKYLLLFGDGTFDNKNLGDFYMPTYQSEKTYETLETFLSDDYFGLLDDNEGAEITNTATEIEDIGVGRIPADDETKAQVEVSKIRSYASNAAYGDWRNQGTFVADDEDFDIHISDANSFADNYAAAEKKTNVDKIYLDAFQQQSGAGGATYPAVNEAINRKLFTGTLFLNYVGHGGPLGLAKERILTYDDINQWTNSTKLPLFITATCEFAPYDKFDEYSAGERVLFKSDGGGIALVTTTRIVYSNRNKTMNENFMAQMVNAYGNEQMNLGDIVREAKKFTNTSDGNRKFTLLGDPALRLAFPKYNVVATLINNKPFTSLHDTLKALSRIVIEGEVQNNSNVLMATFNGLAAVSIYDKAKTIHTLVNDPESPSFPFTLQKNIIYKGRTKVTNGKFKFSFLVPKDIDYNYGIGKISLYASSDTTDASGYDANIVIGGASDTFPLDNKGPVVDVFLNDDKFAFGGITDETPKLFSRLFDENGINTSGNGVGHDITAIIDNDTKKIYNLNDFYETNVDDVSRGVITYPFSKLSKGRHTLQVKAWDVLNNSGVGYTEFIVEEKANLALSHVLNYPNPFTTHTRFMFEHNKPGMPLDLKIEIFTVSGKVIKTIAQNINSEGYRVDDISWDGRDDYGDKIGKGVYIYRISLRDDDGKKVSQYQKLVILN
ncbi:MAG: hypothetical protein JWN78_2627 [Bacteroidota bacterium]|nr:hypothetical protein [Bacteroidota bacterium]